MPTTREGRPVSYGQIPSPSRDGSFRQPRTPADHMRRVLLPGHCRCGAPVEFVAGCGWLAEGTWEPCDHPPIPIRSRRPRRR